MDKRKKRIIIAAIVAAVVLVAAGVSAAFVIDAVKPNENESSYNDVSVEGTIPSVSQTKPSEVSEEASSSPAEQTQENTAKETTTKQKKPEKTTEQTTIKYDPRYISLKIKLPQGKAVQDKLEILINNQVISTQELRVNGQTISFVTPQKYEGDVVVVARLVDYGTFDSATVLKSESSKNLELPLNGIEDNVVEDE